VKPYRLSRAAKQDLADLSDFVEREGGTRAADRVVFAIEAALERISDSPRIGHRRDDVTPSRFASGASSTTW